MSKNLYKKLDDSLNSGELLEIVDNCLANKHVLTKLGFSSKGQYVGIVSKYLIDNEIDTSHFTPNGLPKVSKIVKQCLNCGAEFHTEPRSTKEQVTCSRACSNTYFRSGPDHGNYIDGVSSYRKKALLHYGEVCMKCGYSNARVLEVHHKNKNREDNSIDNLEVLCANCHTLEHYK